MGTRTVPFSRELYIEADDFMEDAPKKFFRLAPGREVRLRYAYFITCTDVVKDKAGQHHRAALHVRPGHARRQRARRPQGEGHDPLGLGAARRIRAADAALRSPVQNRVSRRCAGRQNFPRQHQPELARSRSRDAKLEPSLAQAAPGQHFQFERLGYFFTDPVDSKPGKPVFNRTATLRDTWAKEAAKG